MLESDSDSLVVAGGSGWPHASTFPFKI